MKIITINLSKQNEEEKDGWWGDRKPLPACLRKNKKLQLSNRWEGEM